MDIMRLREENEVLMNTLVRSKLEMAETQSECPPRLSSCRLPSCRLTPQHEEWVRRPWTWRGPETTHPAVMQRCDTPTACSWRMYIAALPFRQHTPQASESGGARAYLILFCASSGPARSLPAA